MNALVSHPAAWLFAGALVVALTRRRLPAGPVGICFAIPALLTLIRPLAGASEAAVAGFRLTWYRADELSLLFALVFAIVALLGLLYGVHRMRPFETAAALAYAGSAIATVLAGDWITFFVFWEAMALSSLGLIWKGGTARARRAGMRYLLVHAAGGSALFVGIALHLAGGEDPLLGPLAAGAPPYWLVLGAVAVNAAIPPLHAWLTDAYPEASPAGSVFLSAFHHEDRGLRAAPALPGNGDPGAARGGDGALRGRLRGHRERPPPAPRLPHREPGRIHGRGGRARHAASP